MHACWLECLVSDTIPNTGVHCEALCVTRPPYLSAAEPAATACTLLGTWNRTC